MVAKGSEKRFIEKVPGCNGQPHVVLDGAGHFLQEDLPETWLEHFMPWLETTR
jgi:haloalkane dehalogenase